MALLLAYPVARWQVVLGKFLGHSRILAFATVARLRRRRVAALATGGGADPAAWSAFAVMIALLGPARRRVHRDRLLWSARGARPRHRGGIAIGVWLLFVLLYDMALLGVLVADQGRTVTARVLDVLLLLNPADAYRLLNLTGTTDVSSVCRTGRARRPDRPVPARCSARCWPGSSCRSAAPSPCSRGGRYRRAMRRSRFLRRSWPCWRAATTSRTRMPPPPRRDRAGCHRAVLRHDAERASRPERPDLRARTCREPYLVRHRPRHLRLHAAAGNAEGHRRRSTSTTWRERRTRTSRRCLGDGAAGMVRDRQPPPQRHGTPEAMPFSEEAAAQRFAADNGGRVVRLADTPQSYILDGGAS